MKIIGGGLLSVRFGVALMCAVGCIRASLAESDYEYARALLDRDQPNFNTKDLVERLIAQLEADPKNATEAKLIRATLYRYEARQASIEKRAKLLADAEKLYGEILKGPKVYAHYASAGRDAGSLYFECARAMKKSAAEDPGNAAQYRGQAASLFAKLAQKYKAEADGAYPLFEKAHKAVGDWQNANDPDRDGKPIPAALLTAVNKAFDNWLEPDQRCVAMLLEQLDCIPDSDPARKTLANEITKLCDERTANERLSEQETATAWYEMMEGKVFALLLNSEEADKHWSEARRIAVLQKPILREQVRLYVKLKKYADVIKAVENFPSDVAQLLGDDVGKEILETYTRALTLEPDAEAEDFQRAIRTLQAMIDREAAGAGETAWSAQFCAAMADIVSGARKRAMLPALKPSEWYSTAMDYVIRADAEHLRYMELQQSDREHARAQFEKSVSEYENAEECFRHAIATAHSATPAARLMIEPKAWLQLGRCYLRAEDFQEALVAYNAFKSLYAPKNRTWLPDPSKSESRAFYTRQVNDRIAELGPLLAKSEAAARFAMSEAVKRKVLPQSVIDETNPSADPVFSRARNEAKTAFETVDLARKQLATDAPAAAISFGQALDGCLRAAEQFGNVKAESADYEAALLGTARAYVMAHSICAVERVKDLTPDEQKKRAREYAQKAFDAFQSYDDYIAKAKAPTESVSTERERQRGPLLLARSTLCCATGAWEHALRNVEAYQAWLKQNPATRDGLDTALLNKFRALVELSAIQAAPEQDRYLNDAYETMLAWRTRKADDAATLGYMVTRLEQRYEKIATEPVAQNNKDATAHCYMRIADLEESRFSVLKAGDATLKDHSYLLFALKRANRNAKAVEAGKRLLDTFDPKGSGTIIPDDAAPWQQLLAKMIGDSATGVKGIVRYDDLTKWDRCKQDHQLLIDYMYDGAQAAQYPDGDGHRPANDRFNVNMDKALAQAQTIRRNYPDCATLKTELGQNGKALLMIVEDEIDFRRKIAAARVLVIELATSQSEALEKSGKSDEAKSYRAIASELLQKEIDAGHDSPELRLRKAGMDASIGNYDEALRILLQLRIELDHESALYFDASKLCSIIYSRQQKWQDAIEFPEFIEQLVGYDSNLVRQRWPEMKEFLAECRAKAKK